MERHDFSYWLTLKGAPETLKSADSATRKLIRKHLVPYTKKDVPSDELRYCVDPRLETIQEWESAEKTITKLANAYPDLFISLSCIDEEEPACSHVHVWHAGKTASDYAVIVIPDADELMKNVAETPVYGSYDEVFESLGWHVDTDEKDGSMTISKHSPAGEDFNFEIDGCDVPGEVRDYADDFDVDEHVDLFAAFRGEHGVPTSYKKLVEDAEEIQTMLYELADALESVKTNCDLGTFDCSTCCIHGSCDREEDDDDDEDAWEELKEALFTAGYDALEDFLGYMFDPDEDKDVTENRLDEAYRQMPEEDLERFFSEYGVDADE